MSCQQLWVQIPLPSLFKFPLIFHFFYQFFHFFSLVANTRYLFKSLKFTPACLNLTEGTSKALKNQELLYYACRVDIIIEGGGGAATMSLPSLPSPYAVDQGSVHAL